MEASVITMKIVDGLDLDVKIDHEKFKEHLKNKLIELLDTYGIEDDYSVNAEAGQQRIQLTINNRKTPSKNMP